MNRNLIFLALLATLSACGDGQPLFEPDTGEQPDQDGAADDDGDGIPNNVDTDDDADGILDSDEADTDDDGLIDDIDRDDDNDNVPDTREADTDDDGLIDDVDGDDDNDGVPDGSEADADNDGIVNDNDPDDDNDGIPDAREADADDDGLINDLDPDDDNDGILDTREADADSDGIINDNDPDDDNDGILDTREVDTDSDGLIDDNDPDDDNDGILDVDEGNGGIGGDPDLPPGTDRPTPTSGIFRQEERNDQGGGFVDGVDYDAETDTFSVDGIAFDGDDIYTREDNPAVTTLNSADGRATYAVYEASAVVPDGVSGVDVDQFQYRAIYGASSTTAANGEPTTQFAIVRTGSYIEYGFGGFVYERNGGVELPTEGQATYSGDYAGIRVLSGPTDGSQDLTYVTGQARVDIDFEDFNEGAGVKGLIFDRIYTDAEGSAVGDLPDTNLTFVVGPGTVSNNGEISSGVVSQNEGEVYENGTYYAIVAGDNASEIVGIVVVESEDPRFEGVTAQETGGFIVYRGDGIDSEQ